MLCSTLGCNVNTWGCGPLLTPTGVILTPQFLQCSVSLISLFSPSFFLLTSLPWLFIHINLSQFLHVSLSLSLMIYLLVSLLTSHSHVRHTSMCSHNASGWYHVTCGGWKKHRALPAPRGRSCSAGNCPLLASRFLLQPHQGAAFTNEPDSDQILITFIFLCAISRNPFFPSKLCC